MSIHLKPKALESTYNEIDEWNLMGDVANFARNYYKIDKINALDLINYISTRI